MPIYGALEVVRLGCYTFNIESLFNLGQINY